jgi:hypothetical protein
MKTQIISCIFSFLFIFFITKKVHAQSPDNFKQNRKTYDEIIKIFKKTSIPTDTIHFKLGGYEKILEPYLDLVEINKKSEKSLINDTLSIDPMYKWLYICLATLHSFTKNFPSDLIKIIPYANSKKIGINWKRTSDLNEMAVIENSILLSIKNKKKYYEALLLNFNPKNRKLNFMVIIDTSKEATEYFRRFYKTDN